MKNLTKLTAILFILLNSIFIFAEGANDIAKPKGSIKGNLLDSSNRHPVEFASIVLYRQKDSQMINGILTDTSGSFVFNKIPAGKYYLVAYFMGYDKKVISNINIDKSDLEQNLGGILINPATKLAQVEISEEKSIVEYRTDRKVVNVEKTQAASGGTAVDALRNTPGVNVDLEGNITIKGKTDFKVLIDGKPSAVDGVQALRNIPAAAVERIELITNPSANYDAEGTAGIINVIMKKQKSEGMSGIINTSAGTGDKYTGSALFNIRKNKTNYNFGVDYNNNKYYPDASFTRKLSLNGDEEINIGKSDRIYSSGNYEFKTGANISLNENNSIALSAKAGHYNYGRDFKTRYHSYSLPATSDIYFLNKDLFELGGEYITGNIFYENSLSDIGDKITLAANYTYANADMDEESKSFLTGSNNEILDYKPSANRYINSSYKHNLRLNSDIVFNINKNNYIEAGYQGDYLVKQSAYIFENYNKTKTSWEEDLNKGGNIDYCQSLQAIYTTFNGKLIGFDYKAGIRAEYYQRRLDREATKTKYPYNKMDIFPSLHISKQLNANQQFQLSYSRRTQRPDDKSLNPFPYYYDDYYVQSGNPELEAEYNDSYELNFQQTIKKIFISLETYYTETKNSMYPKIDLGTDKKLYIMPDNLSENYAFGAGLSGSATLFKIFKINPSISLMNFHQNENKNNNIPALKSNVIDASLSINVNLLKNTTMQVYSTYMGARKTQEFERKPFITSGISLRQELLNRNLSITLNARDIICSKEYKNIMYSGSIRTEMNFTPDAPVISLALVYKINNFKPQFQKSDKTDLNFEKGF
ncbi:MAG: TonB-dependent receptor [Bacteroidales bacterium]|nr:TonB-dependent receptor [Bacteroidales bacterium]